ncbi:hypothetical protein FDK21_06380 [Cohaesibacter sp. CAU 1516]|uniref:hypothetical protein n=1 Tax=Cohaesibacter sp. CAU 1516 TaxID=2576038 RepID=UPI0010FD4DEF|nr:hypothetical protein [Cohaesibacter sp. CAU 1516]TLP49236.1 hypothetical protein FDK21_06380 [Cohaesibacter sp. CAU 1516]
MTDLTLLSRDELFDYIYALERQLDQHAQAQANDHLPHSSKSYHEVSRRIAHDVKAPVRQIAQLSEILVQNTQRVVDEETLTVVDMIKNRAAELDIRLDEIRAFSSAHFLPLNCETVSFVEIVESCRLSLGLGDDRVTFASDEEILVQADRMLLTLLFNNLLIFLFKSYDLSPLIKISLHSDEVSPFARTLDISVSGYVFETTGKSGLFEPFTTISTNDIDMSTGLKLSICAQVCKRHGWTLSEDFSGREGFSIKLHL